MYCSDQKILTTKLTSAVVTTPKGYKDARDNNIRTSLEPLLGPAYSKA